MHPLDRPVWHSLNGAHAALALGGAHAKRFRPDVNMFAAAIDSSPEALSALADLVGQGEHIYLMQVGDIALPPALTVEKQAKGVQLLASRAIAAPTHKHALVPLGPDDAEEMLALATLTEPGPFFARTHLMGRFLGIRVGERLAAMAGERMRAPGFAEVSAVCTHPEFRGQGMARALSAAVAARIVADGDIPFLHSWAHNAPAIRLYESLGFRIRTDFDVVMLTRT